jgi:hypothetical protein
VHLLVNGRLWWYFSFFRFIVQLLCVCIVIAVEPAYWWKTMIWIDLSRYSYACYFWCVSININIYTLLFKTKQLGKLYTVATLPTYNREAVNSNLGLYTRYHDWGIAWFYSSYPCSCLDSIPDCPMICLSTSSPITANYSPFHSKPIFPSGSSFL